MIDPFDPAAVCSFCGGQVSRERRLWTAVSGEAAICAECLERAWQEMQPSLSELELLVQEPFERRLAFVPIDPPPDLPQAATLLADAVRELDDLIDADRLAEARLFARL